MKQLIYALMALLVFGSVSAGFFIPSYGQESSGNGLLAGISGFFTTQVCSPHWVTEYSGCFANDTKVKLYLDDRSCGTSENLPADNGTFYSFCNYCSYNLEYTFNSSCEYNNNTQLYEFNGTVFDTNYATCCNITGLASDCYMDDAGGNKTYNGTFTCEKRLNMEVIAIAIIMIGVMFFLIYLATTISSRNENGQVVPINAMIKILLYATSGVITFFTVQLAYGISLAYALSQGIESNLSTIYTFVTVIIIILIIIMFYGVIINVSYAAANKLGKFFRKRSNNKK